MFLLAVMFMLRAGACSAVAESESGQAGKATAEEREAWIQILEDVDYSTWADYYQMKGVHYMINELKDRSGEYHVYPKEWDTSYRATFIALANALDFGQAEEEQAERADRFGKGPRKAGEDHDGGAHADVGGGAQPGACIVPAAGLRGILRGNRDGLMPENP